MTRIVVLGALLFHRAPAVFVVKFEISKGDFIVEVLPNCVKEALAVEKWAAHQFVEAAGAATIEHPNVVRVYSFGDPFISSASTRQTRFGADHPLSCYRCSVLSRRRETAVNAGGPPDRARLLAVMSQYGLVPARQG